MGMEDQVQAFALRRVGIFCLFRFILLIEKQSDTKRWKHRDRQTWGWRRVLYLLIHSLEWLQQSGPVQAETRSPLGHFLLHSQVHYSKLVQKLGSWDLSYCSNMEYQYCRWWLYPLSHDVNLKRELGFYRKRIKSCGRCSSKVRT